MSERSTAWIQTYTGKQFYPFEPEPEDICIEDIAHALAMQCRYVGHCMRFYSVAEHSVLASRQFTKGSRVLALQALLHDASEAYIGDVGRPLKRSTAFELYREVEARIEAVIFERFNLPTELHSKVKEVDNALLATECAQIMRPGETLNKFQYYGEPLKNVTICGWLPEEAQRRFLERYYQIEGFDVLAREAKREVQSW